MILNNCKVKWARLNEPDRTFTPRWTINVYLSPEQINACRTERIPLKNDDDGTFINVTRNERRKDGKMNQAPRVVDLNKKPFTHDVGNGSVCNVILTPFAWTFSGKTGVTALLDAVQVVEWKEYVGSEDFPDAQPMPSTVAAGDENDDLPF